MHVIMGSHWAAVMEELNIKLKCIVEQLIENANFKITYLARTVNKLYKPERLSNYSDSRE